MRRFYLNVFPVFISLFFFFGKSSTAQKVDSISVPAKSTFNNEIGLQANLFVRQFVNFGVADSITNPFFLTWKHQLCKGKLALRSGIGYTTNRIENDLIDEAKLTVTRRGDIRLGIEKQSWLSKRFKSFFAFDAVYVNEKNVVSIYNNIEVVTDKTSTYSFGGGLTGGLSFHITKRLTLSTESSLYFITGKTLHTSSYSTHIIQGTSYSDLFSNVIWRAPNVLYCNILF